jgi:bifunctional UDP-N-acetylglucosamine pyrophosphorylase/glucosamine-1-phosphate N-acetyltransferase
MARRRAPPTVLILAAGQGTRMRSKTIKLLHPVAGRPMILPLLEAVDALRPGRVVIVVGHQADRVRVEVGSRRAVFVLQREQRGTGHAVLRAARAIGDPRGPLLILNGDLPAIRPETLRRLIGHHARTRAALTVLTTEVDEPHGYGRIVRDSRGRLQRIVEQRDATPAERRLREINCGIYCAGAARLLAALRRLRPDNAQGEVYLTDAVHALVRQGAPVATVGHDDADEVLGVNTREELARAARTLFARKAAAVQAAGVTLLDAARTWIDARSRIGRDSVVYPDVLIEGATVIGEDCVIRPGCRLTDCRLGRRVEILDHSVLTGSRVGDGARIGPFAHLRPGSFLAPDTRVGNFVELKQARLGRGTKASHLSYLGDARIGAGCNIGAGTITCNYDGRHKHVTRLGRGVFVGSDTQLVAPVTVRPGAYVAAGTTVTEDVPAGALAIGRGRQRNIRGWVARRKQGSRAG